MRRTIGASLSAAAVVACLAIATPASASTNLVCSSGCPFTSIQSAINAVTPGTTITIGPGNYFENVKVTKSVTLRGSGLTTVVYPGTSNPECAGGSLCGGAASNIILVEADNVTITKLRLEGDNPNLTSGVVVGGADVDARNGIITNHELGKPFANLDVSKVAVDDVYLRGIYASTSGGTYNFNHDTVQNVQGSGSSIAMFSFEGSGLMEANKVTAANDAISANWSKGTQFVHNVITKSGSGVHTDNNGGAGGTADVIASNTVRECKTDGYGVFVFVPSLSAKVEAKKVTGCAVGLAVFGSAVPGQGPTFTGNVVNGTGAATTGPTYGAYLTTDQLGFAFGDVTATLTGNTLSHFDTGLLVTQTAPSPGEPAGGQATVTASPNNSFLRNGTGANGEAGTVVNAKEDWWGCVAGPTGGKACNTAVGTVDYTPWLVAKP
ncbi:MAG: hypothetical protein JWM66_69 [Solirubrobacterales bacterium]|nr:hypothetical protein [Solirubrobacterales bacterium]